MYFNSENSIFFLLLAHGSKPEAKQAKLTKYFFIIILFFSFFSCTREVQLEKGEHLLYSQSFKGNKEFSSDELELLIPANQKPNSRLFSLPITPAVWWYNLGKSVYDSSKKNKRFRKLTEKLAKLPSDSVFYDAQIARKKIRLKEKLAKLQETRDAQIALFYRNPGEAPAIISDDEIKKTAKNIQAHIYRKGYRDAFVSYKIDTLPNKKIQLTYLIAENAIYKIDSVIYDLKIPKIDSIAFASLPNSLIKPGGNFDENSILSERVRLENLLKNNGFYLFDKQFIAIKTLKTEEDFKKNKRASLKYSLKENDMKVPQLQQYTIESVEFTAIDANTTTKISEIDTSVRYYNGTKYIFIEKQFPVRILDSKIPMRSGNLFSQNEVIETQRQLNILDQFAFANTRFSTAGNGKLKAVITAPTLEKYFVTGDISGNTVQDILGGGISGTFRIRNLLRSLDNLEIGLKFALEGQPSTLNLENQLSREFGANVALNFPELILPYSIARKFAQKRPRTQVSVSANYSSQVYRETLNFRFNGNYSYQKSRYETFQFSPIDMNLTNTPFKSDSFKVALKREPTLIVLYDPQFVSSFNGYYVLNNQIIGQNTKSKYLRIFAESGGTFLNFFKEKDKIDFLDKLIPVASDEQRGYFRFWKINVDYRRFFPITRNSSWAYKINLGISQSYGKNNTMPYQKSFFAGGSNSLRAWSPRSLGPGSSLPSLFDAVSVRYLPQPGDILIESSIEYRTKMFRFLVGDMNLGVFVDAGNVWKWYQTDNKIDKANFDFGRFYKEIAVGAGAGLRWDLSFFVFRYDLGIKVFDPSQPVGQRMVLNNFVFNFNNYYGLQSNFAIGLPF